MHILFVFFFIILFVILDSRSEEIISNIKS